MAKSQTGTKASEPASAAQTSEPAAPSGFDGGFQPKVIRNVTLPVLKLVPDTPVYVRVNGAIFEGKQIKQGDQAEMKPADLMNVTDLVTGQEMQIVCGAVLKSTLTEEYEKDSYVGRCFMITKGKRKDKEGGRGYFTYSIAEIEDPAK